MSIFFISKSLYHSLNQAYQTRAYAWDGNETCVESLAKGTANIGKAAAVVVAMAVYTVCLPIFLAMDICLYFLGCSSSASGERTNCSLIDFYLNRARNDQGKKIEDIWNYSFDKLESDHSFIQWLFPMRERSSVNATAPVVTESARREFLENGALQQNLKRSLRVMLDFYGLKLDEQTGVITKSSGFAARSVNWITPGNHNFARLNRMIHSLGTLGRVDDAAHLYSVLKDLVEIDHRQELEYSLSQFWTPAIAQYRSNLR